METVVEWAASMALIVGAPLLAKQAKECRRSRIRIKVRHLDTTPLRAGEPNAR